MVDHRRDHSAEPEEQAHLDHDEDDREDDSNHGRDEAKPIVEQVAGRKCQYQRHIGIRYRG
ncbi:hypothetical protein [Bradyrhizobium sp. sBnM-33]|uniref:hypothetical protein n=1 Tax=Bradyrhizobium sp. sBnM-33 TaxID=2831780 RepID=UPI00293E0FC4|nr:hypothetical protein [Bradyrhizobium sp. sBnM-33]WOH54849.1 hypothetical protein RX328_03595 [Bradyrhizobium sp. sBnM-33]